MSHTDAIVMVYSILSKTNKKNHLLDKIILPVLSVINQLKWIINQLQYYLTLLQV